MAQDSPSATWRDLIKPSQVAIQVVRNLLRPNGQLIALFHTHRKPDGPPFGVKPQAILAEFTPYFEISSANPIEPPISPKVDAKLTRREKQESTKKSSLNNLISPGASLKVQSQFRSFYDRGTM